MKKKEEPSLLHAQRSFNSIPMAPMLLFLFLHLLATAEAAEVSATDENPLQRMSRSELAHIAGYGEERLSSVLVIGTLDCGVCLAPGSRLLSIHVPGLTKVTLFLSLLQDLFLGVNIPCSWISFSYKVCPLRLYDQAFIIIFLSCIEFND
jgi:hypothetical protein